MSLAKCLKKLKIDSSHEDSIISGLASLTEQGNLEGYRKASLALDQAMNDTLDEQEDLHIQLEKQGYSFKEDSSVKDSKLLEEKLNKQGYTFTITPKNVRDFIAKDKAREAQATTATNLASKFGKRITWIDAKGDFGINGVVVPNIKDVIFLDVNTKYPAHAVMGHELSHHLEYDKPEVYKDLVTSMEGLLKNHKEYADKYKIEGASHKDIVKEMIGDIMGDNFTKQDFWNKLADQDRSLFTKIADTIKAWLEQFIKSNNLGSDAFVKDVKKAREVIALAIAQYKEKGETTSPNESKSKFSKSPAEIKEMPGYENGAVPSWDKSGFIPREMVKAISEWFSGRLTAEGIGHELTHSGSAAGASSYIRINNLKDEVRISGHSKGVFNSQFYAQPRTPNEFDEILKLAQEANPKYSDSEKQAIKDRQKDEEMRVMYPIRLKSADKKLAKGKALTRSEQEAVDWRSAQQPEFLKEKPTSKFSRTMPYTAKEPLTSNVSLEDLKAHPKYQEAKHGNLDSAITLTNDLISKEDVIKAKSAFGKDVIYVPVTQFEKDGINRIPYAIAQKYASETGASINNSLYVKDKAFHTGMKMMERLISRTRFEGNVPKGKYVLVDDVTSSGATLADLSSYIQEQGGDVIGSVLLTNAMRGDKLIADKSLTKLLETKYGNEIRELFGIEPSSLTREEAKYLQGFRTSDELRASANKASTSRAERIRIKTLSKSEDELKDTSAKFSRAEKDYRMEHQSPGREGNAPLSDLTGDGNIYPEDVYSNKAVQYYGTGDAVMDKQSFLKAKSYRGKPDAIVEVYRAVPKGISDTINPGDWVTINKNYAKDHGEAYFDGNYDILSKKVKAGDIFTNGDSIHEWGYEPASDIKFSRAPKLFSKLEQVLESASDKVFSTGSQVKLWLQSNAGKLGIKKDEIYWSGIDNWLDSQGKVTKQQVLEFVKKNGIEDIREYKAGDNEDRVKQINQVDKVMFSRVAPQDSEYLDAVNSGDMEKAQKLVNDKLAIIGAYWHGTPSGDLRGGMTGLHVGTKQAAMEALEARIGIPADGRGWDGTREYGKTLLAGRDRVASGQFGKYRDSGYNMDSPKDDFYAEDHELPTVGNDVKVDPSWKPWIRPVLIVGDMDKRKKTDSAANSLMYKLLSQGKATRGFYYENDGEDAGSVSAVLPNGDHVKIKLPDAVTYDDEGNVIPLSERFNKDNNDIRFSRAKPVTVDGIERPTTNSEGKQINNPVNFWKWFGDSKVVGDQGRPLVVYHGTSKDITVFNPDEGKGKTYGTGSFFSSNPDTSATYTGGVNGGNIMPVYLRMEKPAVLDAQGANWNRLNKNTRITLPEVTVSAQTDEDLLAELHDHTPDQGTTRKLKARNTTLGRLLPDDFRYVDDYGSTDDIARWARQKGYDGLIIHNVVDQGSTGNFANEKSSEPSTIYVAYDANQVKSATGNNGDYSKSNNDIRFSKEAIPEETTYQKSQRTVQDKFNRFSVTRDWLKERGVKLTELSNVYDAEERYHAKVANQLEDFREKVRNPLLEKIAKAGSTLSDVQDYLLAQHAEEANKQIQKVRNDPEALAYGITDEEASDYLSKAKPELASLANELRDITEQAKQLRLDAGILNKDITDNWDNTYKHYIPVKGDESIQGTGKGFNVNHKDKRRLGHEKRNEAVIENILMDYERAVMEVEKNRVGKYLVMFAAEANNPDLITVGQPEKRNILKENNSYAIVDGDGVIQSVYVNKIDAQRNAPKGSSIQKISDPRVIAQASPVLAPNEVNVYMDGHAIRVQINDDLLARAYANMGVESVGAIVEAGRVLNSYLSKVYTGYNPEFIVTNIVRDFTSGIANLTGEEGILMATKAIGNYPKMFADLFRYAVTKKSTKLIDSYRANGGNTGAAYLSDMERLGKEISSEYASYQGVLANIKAGDGANAARAAGRKVFNSTLKWIEHVNQAGENAMRLAAYKAMLDSGKTVEQASKVAKNITVNFNRRGEIGQTANALYLFFNASVQGSAAVLHANLKGKHKYQANALTVGMASLGYMIAAGLGGMDEEEYDKIDETTKERNLIIGSGDSYVKIPIPYGYGFFFNTGRVIADAQRKGEFGKAPYRMAVSAVEELTPFGNLVNSDEINSEQVVGGIAPTALQIPYQMSTNTSLFTGKEIRPVSPFDSSQPEREQMFRNTKGTVYDDVAGLLSNAGFDVSPENIKFLTRTLTGGAGALVDTAVSSSKLKAQGAELDIKEMPFVRKFSGENTISNDRSAYYKAVEEAKKAAEEFSRAKKNNDVSSMKKIMEDKRELLAMDKYANKLRKVIKISRDMQDSVRLNEDIPIAEKRLKLKELEAQESKLYDNYLDVYKARVK